MWLKFNNIGRAEREEESRLDLSILIEKKASKSENLQVVHNLGEPLRTGALGGLAVREVHLEVFSFLVLGVMV